MLCMLLAYNNAGEVVATLDYVVHYDHVLGTALGLIDFAAHEDAGGEMTDVWQVEGAAGSKTWPEWIGARAHDFRVELVGPPGRKRIKALVHRGRPASKDEEGNVIPAVPPSGHRRERAEVEAAIAKRMADAAPYGVPANITDIVGGPERPLLIDDLGRTITRAPAPRPNLPIVRGPGADLALAPDRQ